MHVEGAGGHEDVSGAGEGVRREQQRRHLQRRLGSGEIGDFERTILRRAVKRRNGEGDFWNQSGVGLSSMWSITSVDTRRFRFSSFSPSCFSTASKSVTPPAGSAGVRSSGAGPASTDDRTPNGASAHVSVKFHEPL